MYILQLIISVVIAIGSIVSFAFILIRQENQRQKDLHRWDNIFKKEGIIK